MSIRIVVVDDAIVPRTMITKILRAQENMQVVGTAIDGEGAITQVDLLKPDIVVLDIEMPKLDGISALPQILDKSPNSKVIMSSTLTKRNASISLEALQKGASDYVQKPEAQDSGALERYERELVMKVLALAKTQPPKAIATVATPAPKPVAVTTSYPPTPPRALAIASSTGGPQALTGLFSELGNSLSTVPVFITQHMPAVFTNILAENIRKVGATGCQEGQDGDIVSRGQIYLAPGDYHMRVVRKGSDHAISLSQDAPVNFCRPAADPMISSLVDIYGSNLLLVVLTGMGQDGLEGARILRGKNGYVVAQDETTSVVYGMPKAIVKNNLASAILPLPDIAAYIRKAFGVR